MLCPNCGSEIQSIGETINNKEVYECIACGNRFDEDGDILENPTENQAPKVDDFVQSGVKKRIYEEIAVSMCSGEISLNLKDSRYIEEYICLDCLYPITSEQLGKSTQCPKCNSERSGEEIRRFSVLAMMAYRFGMFYRGQYETQVRLNEAEDYDLPALSTGVITSGGAFLLGILSNAAWDGIKSVYASIKEETESPERYPNVQSANIFMILDFLEMVKDDELIRVLALHIVYNLKKSKLASEDGYTVEQYRHEREQSDHELSDIPTVNDAPKEEDVTVSKYYKKADLGERFEENTRREAPNEAEFEWYKLHFSLDDDMQKKTRKEIVETLINRYIDSIEEAVSLYNESNIHDTIKSEFEQVS